MQVHADGELKEAMLYDKQSGERVRSTVCCHCGTAVVGMSSLECVTRKT